MSFAPQEAPAGKRAPLIPALTTTLLLLLFALRVLSAHAWDPLAFVLLTPADAPPDQADNIGYDGRFAYHIAVNVFGDTTGLDEPNFRYQRILYPLLVKALSLGAPAAVPWAMLAVNLAAAGASACFLGALLLRAGAAPWWGLTLSLSLGYLIAIRFDLLEPLAIFFLLAAVHAYLSGRLGWTVALLALGLLTKELVAVAGVVLVLFELRGVAKRRPDAQRRPDADERPVAARRPPAVRRAAFFRAAALAAAFLPLLAWSLYLSNRFGVPPEAVEKARLTLIPFAGFFGTEDAVAFWVTGLWTVFPAILFGLWALYDLVRNRFDGPPGLLAGLVAAYALFIGLLPHTTWIDPLAVLRWGLGFLAVLLPWLAAAHRKALPYTAALWLPSGLILALVPGLL